MAVSNFSPRFLIQSSKFIFGKSKLLCNNYRFVHQSTTSYPTICTNFQKVQNNEIIGKNRNFCSSTATQNETKIKQQQCSSSLTFQQVMHMRKKQARCSVLIELLSRNYISAATSACEQYGEVKNVYSYGGESENVFLLLEFTNEEDVKNFLSNCQCRNFLDAFTTFSRIVRFDKKVDENTPKTAVTEQGNMRNPANSSKRTVSQMIEDIYVSEKLSELDTRLRFFFCEFLKDSLSGLFPHCDALPFGSSVNGLGRHGCDLDIMIRLYPVQNGQNSEFCFLNKTCIGNITDLQRKCVYALGAYFSTFLPGFHSVQKILHARVPIIKFKHKIIGMDCDISVNNMSAILMSEMLFFCGEVDSRVRPLLYAVKKWAKEASITYEVPGSWITNFGLSLLVIFFLQNRPVPILPGLCEAVQIVGEDCTTHYSVEYLSSITDLQAKASLNDESLAQLLKEFLSFLGTHPFKDRLYSVLGGVATKRKTNFPICMQYPVEEDKNVTKNVSHSELHDLCEKARLSSKFLASNINLKSSASTDLSLLLGVPNIVKLFSQKSGDLDVSKLLAENSFKNNRKRNQRKSF